MGEEGWGGVRGVGQVFLSIKEVVNVEWQIGCSLGDSP